MRGRKSSPDGPASGSVVTVLTNEASFDELMNAYIERAFTWRQLARALAEQGGQPAERAALVRCFASVRHDGETETAGAGTVERPEKLLVHDVFDVIVAANNR